MEPTLLVVFVTAPEDAAEGLARSLVDDRLAACVNVVRGVTSFYRWEGEVQRDVEVLLLVKTTAEGFGRLAEAVRERHPYDLPEVIALPISDGSPEYLRWLSDGVGGE